MKLFALLFLLLPATLFSQVKTEGFSVTGKIAGLEEGSQIKITNVNDTTVISEGQVMNGSFSLKGSIEEPGLYWLVPGSAQPHYIYLENTEISVSGSLTDIRNLSISGSSSHDDFLHFQKVFNPLVGDLNATAAKINKGGVTQSQYDSLMTHYEMIGKGIQLAIDDFINARTGSYVSPWLLFVTEPLYDDIVLMEKRFMRLQKHIRESQIGKNLSAYIEYEKVGAVGTTAIDFVQPDTSGNPVSLSSFRGKYVLVDFWASWCGPCRQENPNVVANFRQFRDKNFTVLGVSLDRPGQKDKWLEAIKKDELAWTHVSDLKFWENEAAQLYRVQGIPYNILVDPNGQIIARNLRGPALRDKLCEIFGCN